MATMPINSKDHINSERRVKAKINGPGHITKMATMPINSKNHYKSSSPEPEGL